jgi:hypothetical protein
LEAIDQVVQVGGALLILAAFILAQVGRLETDSLAYLGLNLVGSTILAIDAAIGAEWGFLLLEGVWAIVSAIGLARTLRRVPGTPG